MKRNLICSPAYTHTHTRTLTDIYDDGLNHFTVCAHQIKQENPDISSTTNSKQQLNQNPNK